MAFVHEGRSEHDPDAAVWKMLSQSRPRGSHGRQLLLGSAPYVLAVGRWRRGREATGSGDFLRRLHGLGESSCCPSSRAPATAMETMSYILNYGDGGHAASSSVAKKSTSTPGC